MSLPLFRSRRGVFVSRVGVAASLLWTLATAVAQPSFTPLGDLPGGTFFSGADGISADGQVVVGVTQSAAGRQAFRWTRSGGMQGLGDFGPVGPYDSIARGVSGNGEVVVGEGRTSSPENRIAFRWTAATGLQPLGSLIPNGDSHARGVSGDGSVIVGLAGSATGSQAFRWTAATGMQGLGQFSGPNLYSDAQAVTPDGSVIVGRSDGVNGAEAYRWTAATGMQGLGDLPGGVFHSEARAVSTDGNTIVGFANNANSRFEPATWTASSGWVGLGYLPIPTHNYGWAYAVSGDGSLVGGFSGRDGLPDTYLGFLWDSAHGMRYVKDVLLSAGVSNLSTWKLTNVWGISADGLTLCGNGINPLGQSEAWIATIPAPGSVVVLAIGVVLLRRRR